MAHSSWTRNFICHILNASKQSAGTPAVTNSFGTMIEFDFGVRSTDLRHVMIERKPPHQRNKKNSPRRGCWLPYVILS
jgi:hypothetical protein